MRSSSVTVFALGALSIGFAASAAQPASDIGRLDALSPGQQLTVTLALPLRNADLTQSVMQDLYTQGSPNYHRFLSTGNFAQKFGPDEATLQRVVAQLKQAGLSVTQTATSLLKVSADAATVQKAFGAELHVYEAAASRNKPAYRYFAPGKTTNAALNLKEFAAIVGLDNRPRFHTHLQHASLHAPVIAATAAPNTTDLPGAWTVIDFAQYYNATPLYAQGITGKGTTIGIVTLASLTPSDAFTYWSSLGLDVRKNRLHIVNIDGGPGAPSDASGSDETTLDVEQSGGIAPGADIFVYQAPNTDQGFLDAFALAIDSNRADAVSTSWGEWESLLQQGSAISDPMAAGDLVAFNNLFIQAALQGQSLSAAAGDAGAYDASDTFPLPGFTNVLSVDHPASDPWITAAGGTTLPGAQLYQLPSGSIFTVNIPKERVWGWEYLNPLCKALGFDPIDCGIYPVGGGGGVSAIFSLPFYQYGVANIVATAPGQKLVQTTPAPAEFLYKLPANFPGRNLPDVSFNADPNTGYLLLYTSDQSGFQAEQFSGGTSFVAPQLAGMTALLDQKVRGRVGLLAIQLYELLDFGIAYKRTPVAGAPLRDITTGNNEFWQGLPGYDQGSGLGVIDISNLATLLSD